MRSSASSAQAREMCTIRSDKTFGQRSSALAVRFFLFVRIFLFGVFLFGTELFPTANVGKTIFSQSGAMMDTIRSDTATVVESVQSATSWAAIIAGGVAAAALTLVLLAFGSGMGFSAVSIAGQPAKDPAAARREVITIFTRAALREGDDLSAADSTYVAQMVSAQTGMSQVDADKRVAEVTKQAKEAADQARKAAAKLSMWLTWARPRWERLRLMSWAGLRRAGSSVMGRGGESSAGKNTALCKPAKRRRTWATSFSG
jgi:hypothetical protein